MYEIYSKISYGIIPMVVEVREWLTIRKRIEIMKRVSEKIVQKEKDVLIVMLVFFSMAGNEEITLN